MFSFFFLVVLLSCFARSCGEIRRSPCYGDNSTTPWTDMDIINLKLTMFFTPSRPGSPRRQVSTRGVPSDARYTLSDDSFDIRDVTEKDDGKFSVRLYGVLTDVLKMEVRDCTRGMDVNYGDSFNLSVLEGAYTLDLVPEWYWDEPPLLLWNLSGDPQAPAEPRRGRLLGRLWTMERLTQEHSGYYTFRKQNRELSYRRKVTVHAIQQYFYKERGEEFTFAYEAHPGGTDMSYTPSGGSEVALMEKAWQNWAAWNQRGLGGRLSVTTAGPRRLLRIKDVRPSDDGVFLLRDQRGNVALSVTLHVSGSDDVGGPSSEVYMAVGISMSVLMLLVVCCYCVKKHRDKRSTKTSSVPLSEAAGTGAVSFSDVDTTQPSTSAHPASTSRGPTYPKEPGSTELHPLMDASSSSSASRQPAASSGALSSTAAEQFELRGIPSAPPDCNVYTSDKLNFPSSSSSSHPTELRSTDYQPLAPGPVESSPVPGLPVFIHPMTHF